METWKQLNQDGVYPEDEGGLAMLAAQTTRKTGIKGDNKSVGTQNDAHFYPVRDAF